MEEYVKKATRVSVIGLVINIVLSLVKLAAGLLAHSTAMVSDAVHSASDVVSTLVVIAGLRVTGKKSDRGHPFGHERLESIASLCLAVLLAGTGVWMGASGIRRLISEGALMEPEWPAMATALLSIAVKEWMYRYTKKHALALGSSGLLADAWHHRSDALSSVASVVGIGGAMLGLPVFDPIASLVICLLILKAGVDIARMALRQVVDAPVDSDIVRRIAEITAAQHNVLRVDALRTRQFGAKFYVEVEIGIDSALTVAQGHAAADLVHDAIEEEFPGVKHCMVHVNPVDDLNP